MKTSISIMVILVERNLEVKLSTIWTVGKVEVGRVRKEKIKDGESQKRQDAGARKGSKVAIHCVFPILWLWRVEKKLHAVVARSTFASQNVQSRGGVGAPSRRR